MSALPEQTAAGALTLDPETSTDFAIIVPAFDEAPNMADLIAEMRAMFERHRLAGDLIIVDDGSTDGTAARALDAAAGWDRLRIVRHRRNFGKTEAIVTGAGATAARYLVLFDADLQHDVEEIPRFLQKLQDGWDIVTGRKIGKYEKRAVSSIYNRLSRLIFRVPVTDTNSMKAFRREVLDEVRLRHDWHRFFVVLAWARGFTITEIDIELLPRRHGVAKYSGRGRIMVGLLDLVSVAFLLFFARKPIILFGMTGLSLAAAGFLVGVVTIVLRVMHAMPPFGFRPLLYLVILLEVLGFLLFGFGFVGELVAHQQSDIDAIERRLAELAPHRPAVMDSRGRPSATATTRSRPQGTS